jgi:hypothetical protein
MDQAIPESDPFDPANLRLDQSHLEGGAAKKLVLTIPVRKPKKQEFVRVRQEESFRLTPAATITLEEDREVYLVTRDWSKTLNRISVLSACSWASPDKRCPSCGQ